MTEIINTGKDKRSLLGFSTKYTKLKIEKLDPIALKQVVDMVKKGYTYVNIAKVLSETHNANINERDVAKVLKGNAQVMSKYRAHIDSYQMMRANLVLNEATKFTENMDRLDSAAEKIEEKLSKAIATDDVVSLSKALTDIARSTTVLIKTFKKMTGAYKEGPSIVVDQSTKQINVATGSDEATNKLAKELGMANFNIKKHKEPENKDGRFKDNKEKIVDAELVSEDDEQEIEEMQED